MHEQHINSCQQHLHVSATASAYHMQHIHLPASRMADPVAGFMLCALWPAVAADGYVTVVAAVAAALATCVDYACHPPCRPCFTSFAKHDTRPQDVSGTKPGSAGQQGQRGSCRPAAGSWPLWSCGSRNQAVCGD
jgi:hypothetical protein